MSSNTIVATGSVLKGSGSLQSVILQGGTISPGNSPGLLTMANLDASNGGFIFELGASTIRGVTYDAVNVENLLTLANTTIWSFNVIDNYAFANGDTYDLFNWGAADMSNFNVSVLEAALPSLANTPDLFWNMSQFTLDGTVSVNVVPEPSAGAMLVAGIASLGLLNALKRNKNSNL